MRAVPVLLVSAACAAGAAAQEAAPLGLDVSLSHEFSTGRYGTPTSTRIQQTTLGVRKRGDGWYADLQLPWVEVRDKAGAALPDSPQGGTAPVEQGLGDAWLKFGMELREADVGRTGVDVVLKLKSRTGNASRGLGTGAWDQVVALEWFRPFAGWSAFGHAGWRNTGDPAGGVPFRNPFLAGIGVQRSLSGGYDAGVTYDWRGAISKLGPLSEATVFAGRNDGPWRYQLYVTGGFTRASAAAAVGVSVRRRF